MIDRELLDDALASEYAKDFLRDAITRVLLRLDKVTYDARAFYRIRAELAHTLLPLTFEEIEVKGAEDPAYRARGIFYVTVCGVVVEYDSRRA